MAHSIITSNCAVSCVYLVSVCRLRHQTLYHCSVQQVFCLALCSDPLPFVPVFLLLSSPVLVFCFSVPLCPLSSLFLVARFYFSVPGFCSSFPFVLLFCFFVPAFWFSLPCDCFLHFGCCLALFHNFCLSLILLFPPPASPAHLHQCPSLLPGHT